MKPSTRVFVRVVAAACLLSVAASTSAADDDVLAGYRQLFAGDAVAAQRHFERLLTANPAALAPRFGLLSCLRERLKADRSVQPDFERRLDALISDANVRYDRSTKDDEALFYLANAYMLCAAYRFDYGKGTFGAARDGARAKRLSDTYVTRHPEHGDAYFALGTYNYYVELAPVLARMLRFVLFLPAGSRPEGLKQLERAYTQGSLFSYQAGLLLMEVYSQYENRPHDGIRVGERLVHEYPDNPQVQFELADLYLSPAVENPARAAEEYRAIIAREDRREVARPAKYQARLSLASALQQQWRVDDAIATLTETIDANPSTPAWVVPTFLLRRASYRALKNDPNAADDARRVRNDSRWKDRYKPADDMVASIEQRRASGEAAIAAALIPGNRLTAERRWDEAAAAYEPVRRAHPNDVHVRYRLARLQFMRGEEQGAAKAFGALAEEKGTPGAIRAQSLLFVARAEDLAGRRDEAKKVYARVVDNYEHESAAWPAKVGLIVAYQRR